MSKLNNVTEPNIHQTQYEMADSKSTSTQKPGMAVRARKLVSRTVYGRLLSLDFFKRHWLAIFMCVLLVMIYISNKYSFQTRMETVNALRNELGVIRTEFIRERSTYMSAIRESAMRDRLDSIGLDLTYQVQPPFQLSYGE